MACSRVLIVVLWIASLSGSVVSIPRFSFGPPRKVLNKSWADGFYGFGPASPTRLVVGDGLVSIDAGDVWTPSPTACPLGAVRAAFLSDCPDKVHSRSAACTAMTSYGQFLPHLTGKEQASNFTADHPLRLEAGSSGKLECTPTGGTIRFVGLPPIVSAKFSKGGLRFGGAASVYLGGGGAHKYLQSVIATLASDAASGATSVLAMGSVDGLLWEYLGPIALAANYPSSQEGPNEMDMAWLPDDKTLLAMIRLDGGDGPKSHPYVNYHRTVSTDRGKTWSPLTAVGAGCARPRLLRIGTTMLLSGGRHRNDNTSDVILWSSHDGSGEQWKAHSLSSAHNAGQKDPALRYDAKVNSTDFSPRETNSYTSLVLLTDTSALVIYDMILYRRVNTSQEFTECVSWPVPGNQTKAGCEAGGDALHDGGTYHFNTGRGTNKSICAAQPNPSKTCRDGCSCCRTARDQMQLVSYTWSMELAISDE